MYQPAKFTLDSGIQGKRTGINVGLSTKGKVTLDITIQGYVEWKIIGAQSRRGKSRVIIYPSLMPIIKYLGFSFLGASI